jgi:hypothetical protein
VPLKGRALALAVWPQPAMRPAGDIDLLVEAAALPEASAALAAAGYRPDAPGAAGWLRPAPTGVFCAPPAGRAAAVDLHARLFRSVGARIDPAELLARARPTTLAGHPVRELDEADRLLYLLVHTAKHAARELKWLLDLYAIALRTDEGTWQRAAGRARARGAARPFYAVARLLADLPDMLADMVADMPADMRQFAPDFTEPGLRLVPRLFIARLISVEGARRGQPLSQWESYALELLLEERLSSRAKMMGGMLEARVRAALAAAERVRTG